MAPERSLRMRQLTFLLLLVAATLTEVAADDARRLWVCLALALAWAAVAVLVSRFVLAPTSARRGIPAHAILILLAVTIAPFVIDPLQRRWTGTGYPVEIQMVFGLRNLGLGLAALGGWALCLRLAGAISLFLMLFGISLTDHPAALPLLGIYCALGGTWLVLAYWSELRGCFVAQQSTVALEMQATRERFPWITILLAIGFFGGALALFVVRPQRVARALGEWLPTSGGTGDFDLFARGGVNDGDDEVAGENARSTGMTESDTFLDSPLPSLYDVFNEVYGEPIKRKDSEQAFALDFRTKVSQLRKPPADNLRPSREFPVTRRQPRQQRDPSDRSARALFEVQGRTPLHVRLIAFDSYDGLAWNEAPMNYRTCLLVRERGSCWMNVDERSVAPIFAEPEAHQFEVAKPVGALVPTPPHVSRFRVGRIDQPDFFSWGQDRVLRMARRSTTPPGTVIQTQCRTVDPRLLDSVTFRRGYPNERFGYCELPPALDPAIAELAAQWAGAQPVGWQQISTVVAHLRSEYAVDTTAVVPEDVVDPLAYFLLQSRRGPDYQFASSAAVLLRTLGYATRLVSGFYVSPEHFDAATQRTPVVGEDIHFWAEVMLPSGDWLVIEATPGFEILGPNLPWYERAWARLSQAAIWCWSHVMELSLGLAALGALWWRRRDLLDAVFVGLWRLFPGRTARQCLRRTLWLLERRGRWVGKRRRPCQTVPAWLLASGPEPPGRSDEVVLLTRMAEWDAYALDLAPPWRSSEVHALCRRVLDRWSMRQWRRAGAASRLCGV